MSTDLPPPPADALPHADDLPTAGLPVADDLPRVEVTAATPLLIDRYLPQFQAVEREHLVVDADIEATWDALVHLDLMTVHSPLLDAAMAARGLPEKVAAWLGRATPPAPPPPELLLTGGMGLPGWLPLGREPGSELLLGAVGRFWTPTIEWYDVTGMTPEAFAAFSEPGWGRIAAGFSLRPYGEARTLASYEARTQTHDDESATRFARYWVLVRPFVGHIMRATLDALGDAAAARTARSS